MVKFLWVLRLFFLENLFFKLLEPPKILMGRLGWAKPRNILFEVKNLHSLKFNSL